MFHSLIYTSSLVCVREISTFEGWRGEGYENIAKIVWIFPNGLFQEEKKRSNTHPVVLFTDEKPSKQKATGSKGTIL